LFTDIILSFTDAVHKFTNAVRSITDKRKIITDTVRNITDMILNLTDSIFFLTNATKKFTNTIPGKKSAIKNHTGPRCFPAKDKLFLFFANHLFLLIKNKKPLIFPAPSAKAEFY
jgi:hypothetical protein